MQDHELERRLDRIETRLDALENALGKPVAQKQAPVPPKVTRPAPSPAVKSAKPETEASSGNLLGAVGMICVLFAAAFTIKLAIDSGWLTPERQLGLAAVLAFGLIGVGLHLLESDRAYASLMPATGVVILYFTVFAAHRFHQLIDFEAALAGTSCVSLVSLWIYARIRHDIYPVAAAVGSYVAPFLFSLGTVSDFSLYYLLLCSLSFALISIWVESRTLTLVAAYLAIATTTLVGGQLQDPQTLAWILPLHFLIFAGGTLLYSVQAKKGLTETEAWSFFPLLLFFYAAEYFFLRQVTPTMAPWFSLGFAVVLIGLYLLAKNSAAGASLHSSGMILAFATVVFFHSFYLTILPEDMRPYLFVLIVLGFAFLPSKKGASGNFLVPKFAAAAILLTEYFRMAQILLSRNDAGWNWIILSLISSGALYVLFLLREGEKEESPGLFILSAAHGLAVLALYRIAYDTGSLAVSGSWLAYSIAVLGAGLARKDRVMVRSSMLPLAFAAGKALLYDVSSAAAPVRIVCLLVTGAVLYACGFLIRKTESWK
ncbi:MAG TPA: DUF2339 domain-containing protein [Bdellovibrionota bacterium]|jgi:hypothetical protein